jgi:hypothetical protein
MIAVTALGPLGCGGRVTDDLPRETATGTVTFEGHPLESGTIQFQPASEKEGIAAGGMITEGEFTIPRTEGPVPGRYHVAIFAAGNSGPGSAEGGGGAVTRRDMKVQVKDLRGAIPLRYNIQTELVAEVKSGGPNTYKFDLKK